MNKKRFSMGIVLFGILLLFAQEGIPGTTVNDRQAVSVTLTEWGVRLDKNAARSGEIVFRVINKGEKMHEMVILKTDVLFNALETVKGKVSEEAAGTIIGEIEKIVPGTKGEIVVNLPEGHYVLLCNLLENGAHEGHYQRGMRVSFTVGR